MGVKQLWKLVSPAGRQISIETLEHSTLAIDVSIWLIQFLKAMRDADGDPIPNGPLIGTLHRCLRLLYHGIRPIFVFDGGVPAVKARLIRRRQLKREADEKDAATLAKRLLAARLRAHELRQKAARKAAKTASTTNGDAAGASATPASSFDPGAQRQEAAARTQPAEEAQKTTATAADSSESSSEDDCAWEKAASDDDASEEDADSVGEPAIEVSGATTLDPDALASLPASMRKEAVEAAQRNQRVAARRSFMPVAGDADAYSATQIAHFLKGAAFRKRLDQAHKKTQTGGRRVQSDPTRRFVFERAGDAFFGAASGETKTGGSSARARMERFIANNRDNVAPTDEEAAPGQSSNTTDDVRSRRTRRRESSRNVAPGRSRRGRRAPLPVAGPRVGLDAYEREVADEEDELLRLELYGNEDDDEPAEEEDDDAPSEEVAQDDREDVAFERRPSEEVVDVAVDDDDDDDAGGGFLREDDGPPRPSSSGVVAPMDEDDDDDIEVASPQSNGAAAPSAEDAAEPVVSSSSAPPAESSKPPTDDDDDDECAWEAAPSEDGQASPSPPEEDDENDDAASVDPPAKDDDTPKAALSSSVELAFADLDDETRRRLDAFFGKTPPATDATTDTPTTTDDTAASATTSAARRDKALASARDQAHRLTSWAGSAFERALREAGHLAETSGRRVEEDDTPPVAAAAADDDDDDDDAVADRAGVSAPKATNENEDAAAAEQAAAPPDDLRRNGDDDDVVETTDAAAADKSPPEEASATPGPIAAEPVVDASDAALEAGHADTAERGSSSAGAEDARDAPLPPEEEEEEEIAAAADDDGEAAPDPSFYEVCPDFDDQLAFALANAASADVDGLEAAAAAASDPREAAALRYVAARVDAERGKSDGVRDDAEEAADDADASDNAPDAQDAVGDALHQQQPEGETRDESDEDPQRDAAEIAALEADMARHRRRLTAHVRDADHVTDELREQVMSLLERLGAPYVVAPMEAEAQCAYLESVGAVEGVVTDDSDALVFGAKRVYKNIFSEQNAVEAYYLADICADHKFDPGDLVALALLLGGDYANGVRGVGIVNAVEIVRAFKVADAKPVEWLGRFARWLATGAIDPPGAERRPRCQDDSSRKDRS